MILDGYKTYIVAVLIAAAGFAKGMGWIDQSVFEAIVAILAGAGAAALRAGVKKSGPLE